MTLICFWLSYVVLLSSFELSVPWLEHGNLILSQSFSFTFQLTMMHHQTMFSCKRVSSSEDTVFGNKSYFNDEPPLWPWHWWLQNYIFAWHSCSWHITILIAMFGYKKLNSSEDTAWTKHSVNLLTFAVTLIKAKHSFHKTVTDWVRFMMIIEMSWTKFR